MNQWLMNLSLKKILLYWVIGFLIGYLAGTLYSYADDQNLNTIEMFQSPSDRTKTVIRYCKDIRIPKSCQRLVVNTRTVEEDYDKIKEWLDKVSD